MFVYANLDEDKVDRLRKFEQLRGLRVVALADVALEPSAVDGEMLGDLKQLEDELGVCLLAVQ